MRKILLTLMLLFCSCVYAQDNVARINQLIESSKGHFNAVIEVTMTDVPGSPGYADYNFEKSVCNFKLNEAELKNSMFTGKLFKFFVYHELSHCHFFAHPFVVFDFPELSPVQNKMMNDFVFLDILLDTDGRNNAYKVYHESYADTRAMALLLAEGYTREDFKSLHQLRKDDFMDGTHSTANAFEEIFTNDWKSMSSAEFEKTVNRIAAKITVANFYKKFFARYYTSVDLFFSLFKSNISTVIKSYHANYPSDAEFRKNVITPLLVTNGMVDKYPVWNAITPYVVKQPDGKNDDQVFNEISFNLYGFATQKEMMKDSLVIEAFLK